MLFTHKFNNNIIFIIIKKILLTLIFLINLYKLFLHISLLRYSYLPQRSKVHIGHFKVFFPEQNHSQIFFSLKTANFYLTSQFKLRIVIHPHLQINLFILIS